MPRNPQHLRDDAIQIWRAGVDAVLPERLFADQIQVSSGTLHVGDLAIRLGDFDRITVVGGGKAGAGMVRGLEATLGEEVLAQHHVEGLVSVPADCLGPTHNVRLAPGRPPGVNEPRAEGASAAREMLARVGSLSQRDLCICLISGGGSALMPAPIEGVTLQQKIDVTRLLSAAGATINQLNTVRAALSQFKGGGLARACGAGVLLTLIISDVLGDPLDIIASGPTVTGPGGAEEALAVLKNLGLSEHDLVKPLVGTLRQSSAQSSPPDTGAEVHNLILANNATAVDAAGMEAERLGYRHAMVSSTTSEGPAEEVGKQLASMALRMRDQPGPDCLISGGEPTVKLADESIRGRGGRNQQLVLSGMAVLGDCRGAVLLSGGTDGEDGPTDAAGALVDEEVARRVSESGFEAADHLRRNDAYPLFDACEGLLRTGPTHTNVCDLRVVVVDQQAEAEEPVG